MTDLTQPLSEHWPTGWTADDTERFLSQHPLPTEFRWERTQKRDGQRVIIPDQPVMPEYRIHKGYGFWLRTTPYFPGLFEEIHDILARWPGDEVLPSPERIGELLRERHAARGAQADLSL